VSADIVAPGIGATRYIGSRMPRKEDPRLLTGRGQFVDDISLPGMLHCAFARSPVARGRIVSINTDIARDLPGVHAVYTNADFADYPVTFFTFFLTPPDVAITPLADGHVRHVGDPVALVIADDRYIAEDAASLIEIEIEEEDPVVTIGDAMRGKPVHAGMDSNVAAEMGAEEMDENLQAVFDSAAHVVTHKVTHQRISQSPMETRGVLASRDGSDEMILYITCQSPHTISRYVSLALGLPQTNIRVIAKDVGGAFGLKNQPWREEMSVIIAAMLFRRPLKWIEDRYENLIAANQAREQEIALKIAFDANGRLVGSHADYSINNGAYPQGPDANIAVHMFMWAAYQMPAYGFLSRGWYTNTIGLAAYRGPWAMESLARETALDIAGRQMGIDPIELRRRNLIGLPQQPTVTTLGIPLEDITPAECLEKLLDYVDVPALRAEQAAARQAGRYLGIGFAAYVEPTGSAGSMPIMTGELAQIRVEPTGKVSAIMSTHSQGHGTATTMAQIIAEKLGVNYDDVTVYEGDSSRGGFAPGAAGSRQGVIGGGASIMAAEKLAAKVKELAAHLLNANAESISIEDGMIHVAGAPDQTRSLRQIAEIAYGEPFRLPPGFEAGLEAQYRYTPPPMTFTSAAHACIVEIDAETGFVKIKRWVSSEDCGNIINPAVVEGQISGGLAQGIGTVLLEEMSFDARGNPTAATYKDYLLPSISDIPVFEFVHACTPSKSVGGFRGVGEGGAIIGPPTLVNAIADALAPFGEIACDLPLTPTKILSVMEGRDLSAHVAPPAPPPAAMAPAIAVPAAMPAPSASATAGIDGAWKMTLFTPMGAQEMTGHFETRDGALSGRLESPEGTMTFTGTAAGAQAKFDLKVEKPMKITLKYDITVDGDRLTGKVKMGMFGTSKLTGERL
jgi:carbon-monoxide dehydrogenase large subunit